MTQFRWIARVTPAQAVPNRTPRRPANRSRINGEVTVMKVDPRVWEVAKRAKRPGEQIIPVSPTEVLITHKK